jgi:hypothetical protein
MIQLVPAKSKWFNNNNLSFEEMFKNSSWLFGPILYTFTNDVATTFS